MARIIERIRSGEPQPRTRHEPALEQPHRVDIDTRDPHPDVQCRSALVPARRTEDLSGFHTVTPPHQDQCEVRVRDLDRAVLDGDGPVPNHGAGERNHPRIDGTDRGADRHPEVDAPVPLILPDRGEGLNDGPVDRSGEAEAGCEENDGQQHDLRRRCRRSTVSRRRPGVKGVQTAAMSAPSMASTAVRRSDAAYGFGSTSAPRE